MKSYHRCAGIHLLELALTLALLGTIVSIGTVQIRASRSRYALKMEADRLKAALETAATSALQHKREIDVQIHLSSYATTLRDDEQSPLFQRVLSLPIAAEESSTLHFYPTGVASPASITLRSGDQLCTVIVSLRARVRVLC